MKRKQYLLYTFAAMMAIAVVPGCRKYLDVNKNVNQPTAVPVALLLSSAERALANNMALGSGLGNTTAIYTHQMTGRVAADRYGAGSQGWDGIFGAITT